MVATPIIVFLAVMFRLGVPYQPQPSWTYAILKALLVMLVIAIGIAGLFVLGGATVEWA